MRCSPEMSKLLGELENKDLLLETTSLISKADSTGKIIYTNQKFCEVSGYNQDELIGQDHKILNSGYHSSEFWKEMYVTAVKQKNIWYGLVTNKTKEGIPYYIKTWVQAEFDKFGDLKGYITVRHDVTELITKQIEIESKNGYLEYAAKILRHDMHSGINTYIPRGVRALKRKLEGTSVIEQFKLETPLRIIVDGLKHTQKVYNGIYEFTNLVKTNGNITMKLCNLSDILDDYISNTSYHKDVIIKELPDVNVCESLFCIAIDNLIKNGLRYNDSPTRIVEISYDPEGNNLLIIDNGRGIDMDDLRSLSAAYARDNSQLESGTGLGLNICQAILKEHKFKISCCKHNLIPPNVGTKFTINLGAKTN